MTIKGRHVTSVKQFVSIRLGRVLVTAFAVMSDSSSLDLESISAADHDLLSSQQEISPDIQVGVARGVPRGVATNQLRQEDVSKAMKPEEVAAWLSRKGIPETFCEKFIGICFIEPIDQ